MECWVCIMAYLWLFVETRGEATRGDDPRTTRVGAMGILALTLERVEALM